MKGKNRRYVMPENMDFVREWQRKIPVYKKVGVLVCGSGSAGLAAAVCAARNRADVLLVERNPFLGGQSTAAYQNWFGGPTDILTGFAKEYAERLDERGGARLLERYSKQTAATGIKPLSYHLSIEPEEWKYLASDMVEEAGVKVITNTLAVKAIVKNRREVKGVVIENKSGRQAILADVVIDATGDADIAARAEVLIDELPKSGYMIAMVPGIRIGGIDYQKVAEYVRNHPEDFRLPPGDFSLGGDNMASIQGLSGWSSLVKEGRDSGEFPDDLQGIGLQIYPTAIKRGIGYLIGAHLSSSIKEGKRYPWNAEHVMQAELDGRKRARKLVAFLQKRVPGFGDCFLIDVSPSVGPQDSRRIIGEYVLTRKDEYEGRTFDDDIALITITWPDVPVVSEDSGWSMHPLVEEMDSAWREVMKSPKFQVIFGVPYRCLIPRGFDGILVAGQTISMTWMAHEPGPCRGMVPCMHWGQAAGTAAAIASKRGISPMQVDSVTLRKTLESQGVNLRKDAIDLSEVTERLLAEGGKISHKA
jgi:glycine/D-amino acid oxidase-like deaminating enzyme